MMHFDTFLIKPLTLILGLLGMGAAVFAQPTQTVEEKRPQAVVNLSEAALASFGRLPFHNGSRIHASELSPDGKLLATLSSRSATVWSTATGQPLHRFFFDIPAWPTYRRGLAFSPDSKRLACGPNSELIIVYDLASGKELRRFATQFEMFACSFLRFSADGAALIVESNDVLSWLDVRTGATIRRLPHARIKQFSPDDKTFVIVRESQKQVLTGDTMTGKIKHTLPIAAMFSDMEHGVLFLPDGVTLAVVCHDGYSIKEIQFWDHTTGKRQARTWTLTKTEGREYYRLTLSPDGKVLYFPEQRKAIRRYSLAANKELESIPLYGEWLPAVFPHPDGNVLFKVGLEEIHRWDVVKGKEISSYKDFLDWREMASSPDGRWLALRGSQYQGSFLELCDTESRRAKRIDWPWGGAPIAFTPDGRSLAVNVGHSDGAKNDSHLQFVSIPELKQGQRLTLPNEAALLSAAITFSKDGRYLATRRDTGHLRVIDVRTGKKLWAQDEVWKVLFTPDSKRILVESRRSGVLSLHDVATQKTVSKIKRPTDRRNRRGGAWITDWAFSSDSRILAVAMSGGHIMLLDASTGMERTRFLSVPLERVGGLDDLYLHTTALAFSPDGQWLAGGGDDGYLRIWEVSTRREIHRLHGHEGAAQALRFSADGRRLVSFGEGEGLLWDLRPRKEKEKGSQPLDDLLSQDGPTVYRALWTLADDPQGPAMLRKKIPPQRVDARPERIALLIADLGAGTFKTRNAAMQALAELEGIARPALLGALQKNPPLEVKRRMEKLLAALNSPTAPALQISRAVQAMELNQSDAARKLLRDWSEGTPGLRLTEEARAVCVRQKFERY
jgi:WD40 repeat protein